MITTHTPNRGFALFISLVLTSVVLSIGVALLDIAFKQVVLASSAKNSQIAFYNADSALECALYWDQQFNAFSYTTPAPQGNIICDTRAVTGYQSPSPPGTTRTTSFTIPCATSGVSATVVVKKQNTGYTDIYANGYNTCDSSSTTRIERGVKAHY